MYIYICIYIYVYIYIYIYIYIYNIYIGGSKYWDYCGPKKVIQQILRKFTKIFNYIKSSFITFSAKMFGYSHYIYWLQKQSTHFGLRVLTKFYLEVPRHFKYKKICKKIDKIHKDL